MVKSSKKKEKKSIPKAFCIGENGKGQNKIVIVLLYVVKTFRLEEKKFEYVGYKSIDIKVFFGNKFFSPSSFRCSMIRQIYSKQMLFFSYRFFFEASCCGFWDEKPYKIMSLGYSNKLISFSLKVPILGLILIRINAGKYYSFFAFQPDAKQHRKNYLFSKIENM